MGEVEAGQFCSICHEPQESDDAEKILLHVTREHFDDKEFQSFVEELRVGGYCDRCGEWFVSRVRALSREVFGAHPYCVECREKNRVLKDLLVDHMGVRDLMARAWIEEEGHEND